MASNNGQMHNLTTLIKRLEAATSRLEDMAEKTVEPVNHGPTTTVANPSGKSGSLPPPAPAAPKLELPESVTDYDNLIATAVQKFVNLSNDVGGVVSQQALLVRKAFIGQRKFLLTSTLAKKPDMPQLMELLNPLQGHIEAISNMREANRASPLFNNLSAVSESIAALAWVTVDAKPHKHIEEMVGSSEYWGNRVLKEYKDKDPKQVQWFRSYHETLKALQEYVQQNFSQGLLWNPKGVASLEAAKMVTSQDSPQTPAKSSAPPPPAGGAPPPPPPPPGPPPIFDIPDQAKSGGPASGYGAVFSELNKGSAVTSGLKRVSVSEMTHKNPSLRAGAIVPEGTPISRTKSPAPGKKPKPETLRAKKSVKILEGNKWIIENFDHEPNPIEINVEISQSVLISRCNNSLIVLHGKGNAVSIDNSTRLNVVLDTLISSVDVIHSQHFQLQINNTVPTILMDKVDQGILFLGPTSMNTEVLSSKCTGINICTLEDDESKETPLPEQIRTYFSTDGKLSSEIVEHSG